MIYLLTIFVGAVVGGLICFVANKFVIEIDEQVLVSQIKVVSLGCVSGACCHRWSGEDLSLYI